MEMFGRHRDPAFHTEGMRDEGGGAGRAEKKMTLYAPASAPDGGQVSTYRHNVPLKQHLMPLLHSMAKGSGHLFAPRRMARRVGPPVWRCCTLQKVGGMLCKGGLA